MSTVVVVHSDSRQANKLAASLDGHFQRVVIARTAEELLAAIPKHRSELAIVDLDVVSLEAVAELRREFGVDIICTHRCADEAMWADALSAGAIDCLYNDDIRAIVAAAARKPMAAAAAA